MSGRRVVHSGPPLHNDAAQASRHAHNLFLCQYTSDVPVHCNVARVVGAHQHQPATAEQTIYNSQKKARMLENDLQSKLNSSSQTGSSSDDSQFGAGRLMTAVPHVPLARVWEF